jgi:lipopolysaccharide export system protein LptC
MSTAAPVSLVLRVRRVWDRLAVYLPLLLMGVMAMTTYWLVRNLSLIHI